MALILSFDTATKHCAVALAEDEQLLAQRVEDGERFSHAEKLNVFIDEIFRKTGKEPKALDAVAVGIGPGSYTGLRIGLSAAKGLCFALDLPLIGLSTLDVLGQELLRSGFAPHTTDVLHPMIDARRMEVFTKEFHPDGARASARPVVLDAAWCEGLDADRRHIVFGDGADKAAEFWAGVGHVLHVRGIRPSVNGLSAAANRAFKQGEFADLAYLVPDYGKEANVTQPSKGAPQ